LGIEARHRKGAVPEGQLRLLTITLQPHHQSPSARDTQHRSFLRPVYLKCWPCSSLLVVVRPLLVALLAAAVLEMAAAVLGVVLEAVVVVGHLLDDHGHCAPRRTVQQQEVARHARRRAPSREGEVEHRLKEREEGGGRRSRRIYNQLQRRKKWRVRSQPLFYRPEPFTGQPDESSAALCMPGASSAVEGPHAPWRGRASRR